MITNSELLSRKFKFKHLKIAVLEKSEADEVLVFTATLSTTTIPGQAISEGLMEINKTLWNQTSARRPRGYWLLGSPENDGVMTSYFVSDEWLNQTPKEIKSKKRLDWGVNE